MQQSWGVGGRDFWLLDTQFVPFPGSSSWVTFSEGYVWGVCLAASLKWQGFVQQDWVNQHDGFWGWNEGYVQTVWTGFHIMLCARNTEENLTAVRGNTTPSEMTDQWYVAWFYREDIHRKIFISPHEAPNSCVFWCTALRGSLRFPAVCKECTTRETVFADRNYAKGHFSKWLKQVFSLEYFIFWVLIQCRVCGGWRPGSTRHQGTSVLARASVNSWGKMQIMDNTWEIFILGFWFGWVVWGWWFFFFVYK